jgi:putative transposase
MSTSTSFLHCVYALSYHLVIVTKYRRKCISAPMLERLREITEQRGRDWRGKLVEFNGEPDSPASSITSRRQVHG